MTMHYFAVINAATDEIVSVCATMNDAVTRCRDYRQPKPNEVFAPYTLRMVHSGYVSMFDVMDGDSTIYRIAELNLHPECEDLFDPDTSILIVRVLKYLFEEDFAVHDEQEAITINRDLRELGSLPDDD